MTTTNEPTIFRVPAQRMEELEAAVTKHNRRAKRLHVAPLAVRVVETETLRRFACNYCMGMSTGKRYVFVEDAIPQHRHPLASGETTEPLEIDPKVWHHVEITGEIPRVDGWEFVSTIDYIEGGVVINDRPGQETPAEYRNVTIPYCDHCNTRRRRHNTFVVRSTETGEHKMVGRNCLADFIRSGDVQRALAFLELERTLGEFGMRDEDEMGWGGGGSWDRFYGTRSFLATVHAMIRAKGYVTGKQSYERDIPSTRGHVTSFIAGPPKDRRAAEAWSFEYRNVNVTDRDKEMGEAALQYVRTEMTGDSDFVHNLKTILAEREERDASHSFGQKYTGFVTAAMGSYLKHLDRLAEAARKKDQYTNEWFGTPKKREVFTLTLDNVRYFDSDFGVRIMYRFHDEEGRVAVWWTGTTPKVDDKRDLDEMKGATLRIKGTVKKHDTWKEYKQTLITRCAVEGIEREAEENEAAQAQTLKAEGE